MQLIRITIVVAVAVSSASFCNGQSFSFSFGTAVGPETITSQTPTLVSTRRDTSTTNTARAITNKQQPQSSVTNEIGKSPCPRGERGLACRQQLALEALTCTGGQCQKCRQGCSTLSPSEWPTCCRDHFLCCRQLASACQQCNKPQLVPFCTAAFKRCF